MILKKNRNHPKLKIINVATFTCCLGFLMTLTACDSSPKNQLAQQQNFICKSLIDGFLKAESLGQYELLSFEPNIHDVVNQRNYIYRVSSDYRMKSNIPHQQRLQFQCKHDSAQRYSVNLLNPVNQRLHHIISLDLPPKETVQALTAFSIKTEE